MNEKQKEYARKWQEEYRIANREKLRLKSRAWRKANPEKDKIIHRRWYENNSDAAYASSEKYRKANLSKHNKRRSLYQRNRYSCDPAYRIRRTVGNRISSAIREMNGNKNNKTIKLIGCTIKELCDHLESLWSVGMSWNNYGQNGWHVDHIKPCASFNLLDPEQQKQCFHWTNLQPLWAIDNIKKSDNY